MLSIAVHLRHPASCQNATRRTDLTRTRGTHGLSVASGFAWRCRLTFRLLSPPTPNLSPQPARPPAPAHLQRPPSFGSIERLLFPGLMIAVAGFSEAAAIGARPGLCRGAAPVPAPVPAPVCQPQGPAAAAPTFTPSTYPCAE